MLCIAKFPSRRLVPARILIRNANTDFFFLMDVWTAEWVLLPELPVLDGLVRLAVT